MTRQAAESSGHDLSGLSEEEEEEVRLGVIRDKRTFSNSNKVSGFFQPRVMIFINNYPLHV